jgi:hypothetical protein
VVPDLGGALRVTIAAMRLECGELQQGATSGSALSYKERERWGALPRCEEHGRGAVVLPQHV